LLGPCFADDRAFTGLQLHLRLQDFAELPDGPLVVVGDDRVCRMCLVNDAKSWVRDMDAKGLGPCPRAAAGCCTCHM
jgi:hypothetical protein